MMYSLRILQENNVFECQNMSIPLTGRPICGCSVKLVTRWCFKRKLLPISFTRWPRWITSSVILLPQVLTCHRHYGMYFFWTCLALRFQMWSWILFIEYPTDHVFIFFSILIFLQKILIIISMKPNYLYTWRTIKCFHSIGPHADASDGIGPALGRQSVLQVCPPVSWLWDTS